MPKLLYKLLDFEKATLVMDFCDRNNLDYDVWNAEDLIMRRQDTKIELGLTEKDWESFNELRQGLSEP